ncbi:inosine/xanthosine triphosphatase [Haloferax sp. MBLA0076]|uniref:Probable inosine/xanthosine triphosphatase n=1 Tax=Haloferax litoreum TaxID=2666140 RepID=A0A6A8GCR6_9EURY|nr:MULTISPECIES: inosine/xanthosine triphosphatase [Haloferax]KAB1192160.1 inosine/xanthosine triphosphatase [Haloferax sp. CBA1148]MRX20609.1 inosine/xanthosine triphosphatase [Haloferax litoreum]
MDIAVGSGNPVKRRAVERAVPHASVAAVAVESGVSEQPVGHDETLSGAVTRARRAFDSGDYDLGVGIEGGVAAVPSSDDSEDELYLIMWAAVTDGERIGRGAGPTFPLPDRIADRIRAGEELGPVMDEVLGTEDIAKNEGAAGAFSEGRITRTDALESAVTAALSPIRSDLYRPQ